MEANSTIGPGIIWHQDPATVSILVLTVIAFLVPMIYVYPPFPPRESDALFETHYKVGLHPSPAKPGLAGAQQQDPQQQQQQQQARPGVPGRIQSLWIYPLKSCRGIELDKSRVVPAGLEFDRLYTLAQLRSPFPVALDAPEADRAAHSWHFVTQRQFPRLATVEVELWRPDLVKCQRRGFASGDAFLIVRFPWREAGWRGALAWVAAKALRGRDGRPEREVMLPVDFPSAAEIEAKGYKYEQVKIWNDTVTALNMESELPEELQLYLGVSNKLGLFRIDPSHLREVYRGAPDRETAGYQPVTGFQDAVGGSGVTSFLFFSSALLIFPPRSRKLTSLHCPVPSAPPQPEQRSGPRGQAGKGREPVPVGRAPVPRQHHNQRHPGVRGGEVEGHPVPARARHAAGPGRLPRVVPHRPVQAAQRGPGPGRQARRRARQVPPPPQERRRGRAPQRLLGDADDAHLQEGRRPRPRDGEHRGHRHVGQGLGDGASQIRQAVRIGCLAE
ncbi:hypothetical protein RB598_001648 [Gaeumannomyces tritici]